MPHSHTVHKIPQQRALSARYDKLDKLGAGDALDRDMLAQAGQTHYRG